MRKFMEVAFTRNYLQSLSKYFTRCIKCRNFSTSKSKSSNKSELNYKIAFIGSDNFSIPSLIVLTQLLRPENVSVVVSNENNIVGRYAKKNSLEIFHWNHFKTKDFSDDISNKRTSGFDFGVVASFGYLIPESVINRFPLGILNVHGSLLPRWRGASPVEHAIMFGDTISGISIMRIAPHKFDVGPVLHKTVIPIHPHIRAPELRTILSKVGADTLVEVISDLPQYISNPLLQKESDVTLSPKLCPEMANVNWSTMSALSVYNLFRGLFGTFKLKTSFLNRKVDLDEIGLISHERNPSSLDNNNANSQKSSQTFDIHTDFKSYYSQPVIEYCSIPLPENAKPGEIIYHKDILFVKCAEKESESGESQLSSWVFVRKVKIGTKWMSSKDFQNGFLSKCKPEQRCFTHIISESNSEENSNNNKKNVLSNK